MSISIKTIFVVPLLLFVLAGCGTNVAETKTASAQIDNNDNEKAETLVSDEILTNDESSSDPEEAEKTVDAEQSEEEIEEVMTIDDLSVKITKIREIVYDFAKPVNEKIIGISLEVCNNGKGIQKYPHCNSFLYS